MGVDTMRAQRSTCGEPVNPNRHGIETHDDRAAEEFREPLSSAAPTHGSAL